MSEYIYYFETEADFNQARSNNYSEPWVSYTEGRGLDYNKDYTKIPFTIEALGSGNITWNLGTDMSVQYSKNKGPWDTLTKNISIPVVEGDEVQIKGNNSKYFSPSGSSYVLNCTARFNLKGNIMSLIGGDEFASLNALTEINALKGIFYNNSTLISAEKLMLPATILTNSCYGNLFRNCTSLVYPPAILPATVLAPNCYQGMFGDCSGLTVAPKLPATTLAANCYTAMFRGCTSLENAPELPATELAPRCYGRAGNWPGADNGMFHGCTSLVKAPELPATTLVIGCYDGMFNGCTSLTTAPVLPAATLADYCYYGMFNGCTNLTTAPELPATTLVTYCYENMFSGCTNLNYIKAMFTTEPSTTYTRNWVSGVASTGTFVKNAAATWTTTGVNGIPTGWAVETATA